MEWSVWFFKLVFPGMKLHIARWWSRWKVWKFLNIYENAIHKNFWIIIAMPRRISISISLILFLHSLCESNEAINFQMNIIQFFIIQCPTVQSFVHPFGLLLMDWMKHSSVVCSCISVWDQPSVANPPPSPPRRLAGWLLAYTLRWLHSL